MLGLRGAGDLIFKTQHYVLVYFIHWRHLYGLWLHHRISVKLTFIIGNLKLSGWLARDLIMRDFTCVWLKSLFKAVSLRYANQINLSFFSTCWNECNPECASSLHSPLSRCLLLFTVISFQKGTARIKNWPVLSSLNWLVPEDLKLWTCL